MFSWPSRRVLMLALRVALLAGCMVLASSLAYRLSTRNGLSNLHDEATHRLELLAAAIDNSISRYALIPNAVALNSDVRALLRAPDSGRRQAAANAFLEQLNNHLGGLAIIVLDTHGRVLASSDWGLTDSYLGEDQSVRPYFRAAASGTPARYYAVDTARNEPGHFFAQPIRDEARDWQVVGVAVVKFSLGELERDLLPRDMPAVVTDDNGIVLLSSVMDWKYRALSPLSGEVAGDITRTRQFGSHRITPFPIDIDRRAAEAGTLVTFAAPPAEQIGTSARQRTFFVLARRIPGSSWQLLTFSALRGVRSQAASHAALAAAATACLLLLLLNLHQRRRNLRQRLEAQVLLERANADLEQKVAARTADLSATNARLRAEVVDRQRAENTLRAAQDELVQAAKMAVLGQLATGISHELAQPLGALRTLSGNAIEFLRRGDLATVEKNLGILGKLVDQMGGIIGPLKDFARKSPARRAAVDVSHAVNNALFILDPRLRRADIAIDNRCAAGQAIAWCDQNRLEQVLVNLLGNAIDAMRGAARRELAIHCAQNGERLYVQVDDSGAGLDAEAAARIFEAFFTTKPAGEGLGLGLAISRDIVREFGGDLTAGNHPGGGARFTVELPAAPADQRP